MGDKNKSKENEDEASLSTKILAVFLVFIFTTGYASITTLKATTIYLVSYFSEFDSSITPLHNSLLFPVTLGFIQFMSPVGGIFENLIGGELSILISSLIVAGAFFLMEIKKTFLFAVLGYGLFGVGLGISNLLPLQRACKYFPNHSGLLVGFSRGYEAALRTYLYLFAEYKINPDKLKANEKDLYDWEVAKNYFNSFHYSTIYIFSSSMGLYILFSLFLRIFEKKKFSRTSSQSIEDLSESSLLPDKDKNPENVENNSEVSEVKVEVSEVLKSGRFWNFSLGLLCVSFFAIIGGSTFRTMATICKIDQDIINQLTIFTNISGVVVTFIFGLLFDCFGFKKLIIPLAILSTASSPFYCFFGLSNQIGFVISTVLISIIYLGIFDIFFPHVVKIYGVKNSVIIGGINSYALGVTLVASNIATYLLNVFLKTEEAENKFPFQLIVGFGGILSAISLILFFFETDVPFKYKEKEYITEDTQKLNKEKF